MADLPENPNNREEEYLADLAGQDGTKPANPWSRKEAYLDAIDGRMDGIEEQIAALATDISLKGSVASQADLPETAAVGDAYITEDTGVMYVYVGESGTEPWVALGGSGGGGGGITELTTADYNWPENNHTSIAPYLLPNGVYMIKPSNGGTVKVNVDKSNTRNISKDCFLFVDGMDDTNKNWVLFCHDDTGTTSWTPIFQAAYLSGTTWMHGLSARNSRTCTNDGDILLGKDIKDNLTTNSAYVPLSAKQGKVLNDKIGDLTTLQTTDKTNVVSAINEVASGGGGPTVVQAAGTSTTDVMSQKATTSMVYADPVNSYNEIRIGNTNSVGTRGVSIGYGTRANGQQNTCIGSRVNEAVFSDYNYLTCLGALASSESIGGVALGYNSEIGLNSSYSVALGANSAVPSGSPGVISVQLKNGHTTEGYNSSEYRLLSGLYDPQSAHDAATKGYVDAHSGPSIVLYADISKLVDSSQVEFYKESSLTTKWTVGEVGDSLYNGASVTLVSRKTSESEYDVRKNYQMLYCYYPYIIDDEKLNETEMRMVFQLEITSGHTSQLVIQTGASRSSTAWSVHYEHL